MTIGPSERTTEARDAQPDVPPPYTAHFARAEVASSYIGKFDSAIDRIRHGLEVEILARYAAGRLFDCSVGSGRLIHALPKVTAYEGMDYSPHFVAHVSEQFPDAEVTQGDLTKPIGRADAGYDTVICLRTLFALPDTDAILGEMLRIAKPGGLVCFDYGRRPKPTRVDGVSITTSGASIENLLAARGLTALACFPLDGLTTRLKRRRLASLLVELSCRLPGAEHLWRVIERWSLRVLSPERTLWILRA